MKTLTKINNDPPISEDVISTVVTLLENGLPSCTLIANNYKGKLYLQKIKLYSEIKVKYVYEDTSYEGTAQKRQGIGPVTVATNADTYHDPRGVVYIGGYFYVFYYRTTDGKLVYKSSPDGENWSEESIASTTAVGRWDAYAVFTDGTYIFIIWNTPTFQWGNPNATSIYTRRGIPSNGTITWDTAIFVRKCDGLGVFHWSKPANR